MKPRHILVIGSILCLAGVIGGSVLAGDDKKPAAEQKPAVEARAEPRVRPAAATSAAGPHLGKTIKLEFKLANPEEEPTFPILCAGNEFSISRDVKEPNEEHSVEINGTITQADDQGRVLMSFKATIRHANFTENIDATFKVSGSAILTMGKEKKLGQLAESTLKVIATVEE